MYTTQTVARLTGLSADTLRAWERRYNAITPQRSGNGRRQYSPDDLRRLLLLRDAVAEGETISQLAPLTDAQIAQRSGGNLVIQDNRTIVQRLLGRIEAYEPRALAAELLAVAATRSPVEFCDSIVSPLLRAVGDGWAENRILVTQEHLASSVVSATCSALMVREDTRPRPRALFATLPGELHEIGALLASFIANARGLESIFAGGGVAPGDLALMARELRVAGVGVSCVLSNPTSCDDLRALATALGEIPLWVGGSAAMLSGPWTGIKSMAQFAAVLDKVLTHTPVQAVH